MVEFVITIKPRISITLKTVAHYEKNKSAKTGDQQMIHCAFLNNIYITGVYTYKNYIVYLYVSGQ